MVRRASNVSVSSEDLSELQSKIDHVNEKLVYFTDKGMGSNSPDIISLLEKCIVHMSTMNTKIKTLEESKQAIEREVNMIRSVNAVQQMNIQDLQRELGLKVSGTPRGNDLKTLGTTRHNSKVAKGIMNFENNLKVNKLVRSKPAVYDIVDQPAYSDMPENDEVSVYNKGKEPRKVKNSRVDKVLEAISLREPSLIIYEDDERLKGCNCSLDDIESKPLRKSMIFDIDDVDIQNNPPIQNLLEIQEYLIENDVRYHDWSAHLSRYYRGKSTKMYFSNGSLEPWSICLYNLYRFVDFRQLDKNRTKELLEIIPTENESVKSYFLRIIKLSEKICTPNIAAIVYTKMAETYYSTDSLKHFDLTNVITLDDMIQFSLNIDPDIKISTLVTTKPNAQTNSEITKSNPVELATSINATQQIKGIELNDNQKISQVKSNNNQRANTKIGNTSQEVSSNSSGTDQKKNSKWRSNVKWDSNHPKTTQNNKQTKTEYPKNQKK
ncbi:hypothetical protein TPHA_0J02120 [Tetrapisispora phaffii CBS 4417]|uniref:Uncharacterized protein n=1 Tax=Tetrapisispora phaffii (strain ATCC 24235 / CBS 4417 / NBRC 1672 / NRRL Y-8282 / UCD 70-5) TaxID=1071381 RepID=G8BYU0_TETPH|nr:hypothetical protein TPHA_0J02120 [Tetrapisispora phaffii CBS 4417]CCE65032.1 hypothetical protein TPHA_0J02120 [Tetrapisispora phaffii CBS 4417]